MGKQTLNQQIERHVVGKRTDGAIASRVIWKTRSKYTPHQGKREMENRHAHFIEYVANAKQMLQDAPINDGDL